MNESRKPLKEVVNMINNKYKPQSLSEKSRYQPPIEVRTSEITPSAFGVRLAKVTKPHFQKKKSTKVASVNLQGGIIGQKEASTLTVTTFQDLRVTKSFEEEGNFALTPESSLSPTVAYSQEKVPRDLLSPENSYVESLSKPVEAKRKRTRSDEWRARRNLKRNEKRMNKNEPLVGDRKQLRKTSKKIRHLETVLLNLMTEIGVDSKRGKLELQIRHLRGREKTLRNRIQLTPSEPFKQS